VLAIINASVAVQEARAMITTAAGVLSTLDEVQTDDRAARAMSVLRYGLKQLEVASTQLGSLEPFA
jgi:hypothetical protein